MQNEELLSLSEVAKYLKIPKSTIYKLSQKKQIPSSKIGKQLRFRKSSVDDWLSRKEGAAPKASVPALYIGKEIATSAQTTQKNILLIEDDRLVLKGLVKLLNSYGYNLEVAESGEDALKKIKKQKFDLIITDVRMPGMDGIEAIRRIRGYSKKNKRRPAGEIIISGYLDAKAQQEAENLGISDFLYKPFSTTDFLQIIQKKLSTENKK